MSEKNHVEIAKTAIGVSGFGWMIWKNLSAEVHGNDLFFQKPKAG